ncbi:MAG: hypothetical protein JXA08_05035 [Methanomicrobiaceae archaeon]|nr:hypothetical protein [Methanomicrobiaceae archaeon]
MEKESKFEISGFEAIRRTPRLYAGQSSSIIYLPKEWGDSPVMVVRQEEIGKYHVLVELDGSAAPFRRENFQTLLEAHARLTEYYGPNVFLFTEDKRAVKPDEILGDLAVEEDILIYADVEDPGCEYCQDGITPVIGRVRVVEKR